MPPARHTDAESKPKRTRHKLSRELKFEEMQLDKCACNANTNMTCSSTSDPINERRQACNNSIWLAAVSTLEPCAEQVCHQPKCASENTACRYVV